MGLEELPTCMGHVRMDVSVVGFHGLCQSTFLRAPAGPELMHVGQGGSGAGAVHNLKMEPSRHGEEYGNLVDIQVEHTSHKVVELVAQ